MKMVPMEILQKILKRCDALLQTDFSKKKNLTLLQGQLLSTAAMCLTKMIQFLDLV